MPSNANRFLAALLTVVVGLQLWMLTRQGDFQQQMNRAAMTQNQTEGRLRQELSSIQNTLLELARAEQWVFVQREAVDPNNTCDAAQVRLQWELLQWETGTTARLLYRTSPDQDWQESPVDSLGGQNYAASFTIPVKPMLRIGYDVSYPAGPNSRAARAEAGATASGGKDVSYQYQIIAEGPHSSQSSGLRSLPIAHQLQIPVKAIIRIDEGGKYQVAVHSESKPDRSCAQLQSAEVRAYAGDQLVESLPLAAQDERLFAQWQSDASLTRLELVLRHSGEEEIVSISVAQR